jgi:hypothetical protein
MEGANMPQDTNSANGNQLLKRVIAASGQEGDLVQAAQALLRKRVRRIMPLRSMALEKRLPAGTLGRVIEVAQPLWFFARQDGRPQPEHTMDVSEPTVTIVWDIPGGEDEFEETLHWNEYQANICEA